MKCFHSCSSLCLSVPPLEGFVMNRVQGDYFETLLYKIFVSIDEQTNVAEVGFRNVFYCPHPLRLWNVIWLCVCVCVYWSAFQLRPNFFLSLSLSYSFLPLCLSAGECVGDRLGLSEGGYPLVAECVTPNIMYRLKYFFHKKRGEMAGLGNVAPLLKLALTECRGNFLCFHCGFEEILRRTFSLSVCLETYSVTVERNNSLFLFCFFCNLCFGAR